MINPFQGRAIDILVSLVATLALFLAYAAIPAVGIVPGLFIPLPAIYVSLKRGVSYGVATVVICGAILAVGADPLTATFYLLQNGCISVLLPFLLLRGKGAAWTIAVAVAMSGLLIVLAGSIYALSRDVDIHRLVLTGIDSSISQTLSLYEKSGVKGEELEMLRQGMKQGGGLLGRMYPTLVLMCLAAVAGFNLRAVAKLAKRLPQPVRLGEFREFRNPDHLIWGLIVSGFGLFAPLPLLSDAALNLFILVTSLYFLQGLAIVVHYFYRATTPFFLRGIFYLLLLIQPYLMAVVSGIGIFDLWGNFRTPRQRENL